VWRRLRYRTPATSQGRLLHHLLRRALGAASLPARRVRRNDLASPDTLYAFFDLQVSPITYDSAWFAIAADRARRRLGLERIHFVIVPGKLEGVREERAEYDAVVDRDMRRWRVHNIVIPVLGLVPSATGFTVLPSRQAAAPIRAAAGPHVYPSSYELALPVGHHPAEILDAARAGESGLTTLEASSQAQRFIEQWAASRVGDRRLITITVRDYAFMPARNSNLGAWVIFARRLDPARYRVVFVLDTERTLDPLPPGLGADDVFREASWNVQLRLALYERAFLNLGVNNGPLLMAALGARARLLVFKMITSTVPQTTEEFMRKLGFEIGGQLPFGGPFQRLVWEDDRLDVIEREFHAMVARIEQAGGEVR